MRGISWVAEDILASQEGLCFMELDSYDKMKISKSVFWLFNFLNFLQVCLIITYT